MKKKAVIFDLDGTLLNTLDDLTTATNFVLKKYNYPGRTTDEIRQFVGNGVSKLFERALPNRVSNQNLHKYIEEFKAYYGLNMFNKTAPYDGIIPMLEQLKEMGLKIAVVSNKFDDAVKKICKKYFDNLIDYCAGENESKGIRKKPAPDSILKILKEFNINANDTIYVGDSEVDIQTAQNANIECISVLWGFKNQDFLLNHGAKILISKPDEIFKYVN